MDELSLRTEIVEQWGGVYKVSDAQWDSARRLAQMSMIAWNSLAGPPRGGDLRYMQEVATVVGTTSTKPRTVLRRLIEHVESELGWTPTPSVLKAAGKQVSTA